MAIYHLQIKIIGRGEKCQCHSATAGSAYRSASKILDERTGILHDYTKKTGVEYSEIMTPEHAPEWANDRAILWNEVEKIEKSSDAQLSREIEMSLPKELNKEQHIELVREYVKENFVNRGMVADFSIHDKRDGNPHCHIMLTMRPFNQDGTWGAKSKKEYILDKNGNKTYDKKGNAKSRKINTTDWDNRENAEKWRANWAEKSNEHLRKAGYDKTHYIDHRSYERQGIEKIPTKHMGAKAHYLEKRGIKTEIGELNRQIKQFNQEKIVELEKYRQLKKELQEAKKKLHKKYKFKSEDDAIRFHIIKDYKKEFPEIRYVRKQESRAIFNLNSQIGKRATVKAIYDMYNALVKSIELDRKLSQEIERVIQAKSLNGEIQQRSIQREELSKGMFGKMKNKADIERINSEIERLEYKLKGMGIDTSNIDQKIKELNEAKTKNSNNVEVFRKTTEAKKAIDETRRRAYERRRQYGKYRKQQKEKQEEKERGFGR